MNKIYLFILFMFIFFLTKNNFSESFVNYYKCNRNNYKPYLNKVIKNTLKSNKITLSTFKSSSLYLPCKYTTVENEIKKYSFNKDQILFVVNGCDNIVSKSKLWSILLTKYGRVKASKIMPESFLIESDIENFKKRYKKNKLYILKNKLQRKQGLYLTDDYNFIINSKNQGYKVIQDYIKDVFLINKRKLNIRIYIVILCYQNIFSCYIYNNGKCIYTNNDYDYNSKDLHSHITSLDLDLDIYKKNPLTLKDLEIYMNSNNNNYNKLWNNIIKNIKKSTLAFKSKLYTDKKLKNNLSFQIFGPDIIVDKNLNAFIVEINKGPSMKSKIPKESELKSNLYLDTFNLVHHFCKINKINRLLNELDGNYNNFIKIY